MMGDDFLLVSRDVSLTYINDLGMTLTMSRGAVFHLWDCREQMENSISSEKIMHIDGEMFTNMSMAPRHMEITGFIDAVAGRRQLEGELKKVFNTGVAGTLEYFHKADNRRYTIRCHVENTPNVVWANARVEFSIHLKCLDPFWYGDEITHTIPATGLTFENIGDSVAGFDVVLNGTAAQPFIENDAGERITFVSSISNQTLRFISMPDRSMVERGGVAAMQFLSNPGWRSFFLLNIGANTVRFGTATGNVTASLSYRPRYLGTF